VITNAVSGFVTEQALGITVGGVSLIVAPKVVPRVAPQLANIVRNVAVSSAKSVAQGAQQASNVVIVSTRSAGGSVLTIVRATPAKPITEAGQALVVTASNSILRLGEEWEDLFAEAHEMRDTSGKAIGARDIVKNLDKAKVISQLPGRVRLRVGQLEGQGLVAQRVEEALVCIDGINKVRTSAHTGSVLIFYDTDRHPSLASLLQAVSSS
jgi:hypothetical protein